MQVEAFGKVMEVPQSMVDMFIKDFETLPGSGQRESVLQLRRTVFEVLDYIAEEPEALDEYEYRHDFIKAIAMHFALQQHGLLLDS
jgi:hypothetical protein